jgi:hypothetical protein
MQHQERERLRLIVNYRRQFFDCATFSNQIGCEISVQAENLTAAFHLDSR